MIVGGNNAENHSLTFKLRCEQFDMIKIKLKDKNMKTLFFIGISLVLFQACRKSDSQDTLYSDFSIYLTKDSIVKTGLDLNKVIIDKPLIKYADIVSYDSSKHILELSYKTDTLILNKRLDGCGFVAVLNSDIKVYCGIILSPIHSNTNPNITLTLPLDNIVNDRRFEILDNYHDSSLNRGNIKINDKRIIELFRKDKKLK